LKQITRRYANSSGQFGGGNGSGSPGQADQHTDRIVRRPVQLHHPSPPLLSHNSLYVLSSLYFSFRREKVSSLTTCAIRQASFSAIFRSTPASISHAVKNRCRS